MKTVITFVKMQFRKALLALLLSLLACSWLFGQVVSAESIAVRDQEGLSRGFLAMRTLEGQQIADGDSSQSHTASALQATRRFALRTGQSTMKRQ